MWADGFSVELKENGVATLKVNGVSENGSWSLDGEQIKVSVTGLDLSGTLVGDLITFENVSGSGVTLYFTRDGAAMPGEQPQPSEQPTDAYSWWSGDWYGWWSVVDAGGVYNDENIYLYCAWDVCAVIENNGDGTGSITIWDEDGDDIASAEISFAPGKSEKGSMTSISGNFANGEIIQGEWNTDPADGMVGQFGDMICLHGVYVQPSNADNWLEYYIFLRPWGTRWEDVEAADTTDMIYSDMMPINYYDWYLPLIEAGEAMPDTFDGLN